MMDCKKALGENNGDGSIGRLASRQGPRRAAKKAGRTAAEGLVGVPSTAPGAL